MVVAEPRPPDVQRGHEGVGVLELLQHSLRPGAAGQDIGQGAADALEHRRRRAGRAPPAAGARAPRPAGSPRPCARCRRTRHEPLGVGMLGERDRRQPQPAAHPSVRSCSSARSGSESRCRPPPAARASPPGRSAEPGPGSARAPARRRRCSRAGSAASPAPPAPGRQPSQEQLSDAARRPTRARAGRRAPARRPLERLQIRQQPFDDELAAQRGSRADPGHRRILADTPASASITDSQNRCPSRSPARSTPTPPIAQPRRLQPRAHQHRLAAPRRPAPRHSAGRRGRQPLEQLGTLDQPPPTGIDDLEGRHSRARCSARPWPLQSTQARCAIRSEYASPGRSRKACDDRSPAPLLELAHGETTTAPADRRSAAPKARTLPSGA